MEIQLNELNTIWQRLMKAFEEKGISKIEVSKDYYWNIPSNHLYDSYEKPEEFTVGQVSWDWEALQSLLENENYPIRNNLINLAVVLRAIGDEHLNW